MDRTRPVSPRPQTRLPSSDASPADYAKALTQDNTGLTHLGAREYDPVTGRFISVDPLLDTGDPQQ